MAKISFEIPDIMVDVANSEGILARPYDLCHACPFIGQSCDGPDCLAMRYERWVVWINEWARKRGLTRARIAEESEHPVSTVNYALSGSAKDIKVSTMADITRVVIGGSWGQYPCHFAALLLRGDIGGESDQAGLAQLQKQLEAQAADAQRKIDYLREDVAARDRRIATLDSQALEQHNTIKSYRRTVTMLIAPMVLFSMYLVYDLMHPEFGVTKLILDLLGGLL